MYFYLYSRITLQKRSVRAIKKRSQREEILPQHPHTASSNTKSLMSSWKPWSKSGSSSETHSAPRIRRRSEILLTGAPLPKKYRPKVHMIRTKTVENPRGVTIYT
ncbi:hypothetical protein AB6A40_004642 [Gnathostoma spinigerum]|uniref:Uncharacterized protein n=1 Tax=Gnathostoma spinigerum TaxID=75299 RepID=A0ABD6ED43_9BILA